MKKLFAVMLTMMLVLSLVCSAMAADLVWAGWSGEEASTKPSIEEMIRSYNEGDSGNTVTWVGWPWAEMAQQLVIRLQGGEALDIAQLDSGMFSTIFQMDVCYTVEELFDEEFLDTLSDVGLDYGTTMDGKRVGIPWTMASIGMLYNPELLAAVGWDAPPQTLEEFETCCAALKAYDPDIIPYGLSTKDATATADFQPWLWAHGGSIFNNDTLVINSDETIKTLTWYQKMAEAGYIKSNMSRFDARQLFAQGKIAFYDDVVGSRSTAIANGVPEDRINDVIAPMLRPVINEGDTPNSTTWGHILVVFKNSSDPQAAADFIKHVLSDEMSLLYFEQAAQLPVTESALNADIVKNDQWCNTWASITATGRKNELMIHPYSAALNNVISEEIQAVIVGQKTPEEAAASMETRMLAAMED